MQKIVSKSLTDGKNTLNFMVQQLIKHTVTCSLLRCSEKLCSRNGPKIWL